MNVTNLNIAPKSLGNKPIEANTSASLESRDDPNNFANALKSQEKFFKEPKTKEELPTAQQSIEKQPSDTKVKANADDSHQELSALLEKYLPPATEDKEAPMTADLGSTLAALTDGQAAAVPNNPPVDDGHQELAALIEKHLPPATEDKEAPSADLGSTLAILTDGQAAAVPINPPVDVSVTQDLSSAMALTGLAFAKPAPEQVKLTISVEDVTPKVSLQKATILGQSAQVSQGADLPSTDNAETFKQTLVSLAGAEQKAPEISTEMLPPPKPVDTRMDSPIITRPLNHPGWSKDLGEHIIWMNNKDISAAEIKLNPAHLGPISIRIDVGQDNQTSILFTAQHAETKEALESSIPKLKEMLLGQQLNLVNVNISQNSSSNNGRPSSQAFYGTPGNSNNPNPETFSTPLDLSESDQVINKGLLSLYA